jgi:hypothetical protein
MNVNEQEGWLRPIKKAAGMEDTCGCDLAQSLRLCHGLKKVVSSEHFPL